MMEIMVVSGEKGYGGMNQGKKSGAVSSDGHSCHSMVLARR